MNLIAEDASPSREEVYQALVRSLRRRKGFGIVFVQCSPAEATRLIKEIQTDLPQKEFTNLNFNAPIDNLYDLVTELPNRENLNILFIEGLEKSLEPYIKPGYGGDGDYYTLDTVPTILSHLNQRRELFRDNFKNICFVFFLPYFAIKYIIRRSPDLFDWSAGVFEFSSEEDFQREAFNRYEKMGVKSRSLGQYQEAIDFFKQSLAIANYTGDRQGTGNALSNLGDVYFSLGQYEQAINFFKQSLDIANYTGDRQGEGVALGNLGNAYYSLGQYDRAIDFYQQLLTIAREICDRQGEGVALGNLGTIYKSVGNYEQAIYFYREQLAFAQNIGDINCENAAKVGLKNVYSRYDNLLSSLRELI